LVVVSELWNHYAAAALKARLPYVTVPTHRAGRLSGRSRMNFIGLVTHGLGALSVESETIGVRMLVVSLVLMSCLVSALLATVAIRLGTGLAIPG
jgi:polyisoprenyl-phosphate glycosyltransferase